jgi:predicted PurR-regulated permease PerM
MIKRHIFNYILYAVFWLFLFWVLFTYTQELTIYAIGSLIAYICYPLVQKMHEFFAEKKLPYAVSRGLSILILFVMLISGATFLVWTVGDLILTQFILLARQLSQSSGFISDLLKQWGVAIPTRDITEIINYIGISPMSLAQGAVSVILGTTSTTFSLLLSIIVLPFWLFFMLYDPVSIRKGMLRLFPERIREDVAKMGTLTDTILSRYIKSQLLIGLIIGVITYVGLILIGMPNAVALGIITGVLELVPFFGPILAWLIAFIVAIQSGIDMMIWVSVVFLIIQQSESNLFLPRIQGETVKLPAWIVILVTTLSGAIAGIPGMIIGLPVAAVAKDIIHYLHLRLRKNAPSPDEVAQQVNNNPFNFDRF